MEHDWERSLKGNLPTLVCVRCGYIWMPDKPKPKAKCKGKSNESK